MGDNDGAPLWFQTMRRADDHAEFILIGSTIGVVDNPDTQVTTTGSDWQKQFADKVVSWCEQPAAAAMLSRVMGQFGSQTTPVVQRKTADECFPIAPDSKFKPERVLLAYYTDEIRVWTSPTDPTQVPIGAAGRQVVFIYRIPAYRDIQLLDEVLFHATSSLSRVHELLANPAATLAGRRDHQLSGQLEQFLRDSGVTAYSALVRMQNAHNQAQSKGRSTITDVPDLSRISAIVADAMEALRDNPDPGWQRLLEYGDLGFPAAVMYQKSGKWPTPQERAAIEDVYQRLCESLALDTSANGRPSKRWSTPAFQLNSNRPRPCLKTSVNGSATGAAHSGRQAINSVVRAEPHSSHEPADLDCAAVGRDQLMRSELCFDKPRVRSQRCFQNSQCRRDPDQGVRVMQKCEPDFSRRRGVPCHCASNFPICIIGALDEAFDRKRWVAGRNATHCPIDIVR